MKRARIKAKLVVAGDVLCSQPLSRGRQCLCLHVRPFQRLHEIKTSMHQWFHDLATQPRILLLLLGTPMPDVAKQPPVAATQRVDKPDQTVLQQMPLMDWT
jgi:hypothetical protein